jgi:hypothetical protein
MSNAQAFFDLACGKGVQSADEMDRGHVPVSIVAMSEARMETDPIIQVASTLANHLVVYAGQLGSEAANGPIIWPITIVWEVRIGGRNFESRTPLFSRKTMLVDESDKRRGLVFAMQGPLFRRMMLSARLLSPVAGVEQTARVNVCLDLSVGYSGGAAHLAVRVGDVIG